MINTFCHDLFTLTFLSYLCCEWLNKCMYCRMIRSMYPKVITLKPIVITSNNIGSVFLIRQTDDRSILAGRFQLLTIHWILLNHTLNIVNIFTWKISLCIFKIFVDFLIRGINKWRPLLSIWLLDTFCFDGFNCKQIELDCKLNTCVTNDHTVRTISA